MGFPLLPTLTESSSVLSTIPVVTRAVASSGVRLHAAAAAAAMSAAARSTLSRDLLPMCTLPPRLTTSIAAALPMPLEPPMIIASTTLS